jgi:hypothetical protein
MYVVPGNCQLEINKKYLDPDLNLQKISDLNLNPQPCLLNFTKEIFPVMQLVSTQYLSIIFYPCEIS